MRPTVPPKTGYLQFLHPLSAVSRLSPFLREHQLFAQTPIK